MSITIKTGDEIDGMRQACRLASEVLDYLTPHVRPGVTTNELDRLAHDYIVNVQQAIPAPLNYAPPGYKPYPKSICTSLNHQVCHGIPGDRVLKNGDVLNIDVVRPAQFAAAFELGGHAGRGRVGRRGAVARGRRHARQALDRLG